MRVREPRHATTILALALLMVLAFDGAAWAAAGDLDTSFDLDGKVVTDATANNDFGQAVAVQTDGKIVAAGFWAGQGEADFVVVRYNADGSLDPTFDGDGIAVTDLRGFADEAFAVAIQANGRIVVAGYTSNGTAEDFGLVRYRTDGTLDTSFSGDGKLATNFGGDESASGLAIQTDGKIVAVGNTRTSTGVSDFAIARYMPSGALDTSFSGDGKQTTDFSGNADVANAVTIQTDGKIVVGGRTAPPTVGEDFAIARYNSDGSLDAAFSGDGMQTTDFRGGLDLITGVAVQTNGKIVAGGSTEGSNGQDYALARYTPVGDLDAAFSGDGLQTTTFGFDDEIGGLAIQADGKIVAGGHSWNGSTWDFSVARYRVTGVLDTTFSGDGKQMTDFGSSDDLAWDLAIQADGKIVLAGQLGTGSTTKFALARYLAA